jgi:peptidoglycan/LPS O-acetylase OafA/YrhL
LLSYAIYLTHSLAIEASASLAASFGVSLQSATGIGLAGIMMLLFAALLYYTVERPGLALRDRLLNTQKPHSSQSILKPALEAGN